MTKSSPRWKHQDSRLRLTGGPPGWSDRQAMRRADGLPTGPAAFPYGAAAAAVRRAVAAQRHRATPLDHAARRALDRAHGCLAWCRLADLAAAQASGAPQPAGAAGGHRID